MIIHLFLASAASFLTNLLGWFNKDLVSDITDFRTSKATCSEADDFRDSGISEKTQNTRLITSLQSNV